MTLLATALVCGFLLAQVRTMPPSATAAKQVELFGEPTGVFDAAERRLIKTLEKLEDKPQAGAFYAEAALALESLVRLNPRFPQLDEATLKRLPTMLAGADVNDTAPVQTAAMRILMPRGVDA